MATGPPEHIKPPKNITKGYGLKNQIKLRLIDENATFIYSNNDTLLLTAFNPINKENGFYYTFLDTKQEPKLLTMEPFFIYLQGSQEENGGILYAKPLKAERAAKWIVSRQSVQEAPNFYITTDFKHYKRLTDIQPQKKYNWLTAELITWQQLDGTFSQGILYKPENFDPNRKYPIILNYYEQLSHYLHVFPKPTITHGNINIPWFVSRGYLVFLPIFIIPFSNLERAHLIR